MAPQDIELCAHFPHRPYAAMMALPFQHPPFPSLSREGEGGDADGAVTGFSEGRHHNSRYDNCCSGGREDTPVSTGEDEDRLENCGRGTGANGVMGVLGWQGDGLCDPDEGEEICSPPSPAPSFPRNPPPSVALLKGGEYNIPLVLLHSLYRHQRWH